MGSWIWLSCNYFFSLELSLEKEIPWLNKRVALVKQITVFISLINIKITHNNLFTNVGTPTPAFSFITLKLVSFSVSPFGSI